MSVQGDRSYRRRQLIVNRPLQFRFIRAMLVILCVLTVIAMASVYVTLWMVLQAFNLQRDPVAVALFSTIVWSIALELLIVVPFVIWMGAVLTHKVAGPLVRIHAGLAQLAQGNYNVHISLRQGDSLTDVAEAVNHLANALRSRPS